MPRPFASGQIAFGLVSIPVKLYSAAESSERISFNMIHESCGGRIQQQLFCPTEEKTVERSEIVKGYEFSKGQYVLFSADELKALEATPSESIEISEFLPSSQIDPIYFSKAYYLAPDKGGSRAYTLLTKALQETDRWALAAYSARGKQYLVVIRPLGKGMVMQQLYYPNEIRSFEDLDIGEALVNDKELKMAVQLAEMGAAEEFHPENYRDEVQERVRALIQKKVDDGSEITESATGTRPQAQVIDLMEALKASLAGSRPRSASSSSKAAPAKSSKPETVKTEARRKPAQAAPRAAGKVVKAGRK
ncbi:MAG: Ku protein [Acidobacteriota bacterium]